MRWPDIATLLTHVSVVVSLCSQEEMCGIRARWVIARMKDAQVTRNRPKVNTPREAMYEFNVRASCTYPTIASFVCAASPTPAVILLDALDNTSHTSHSLGVLQTRPNGLRPLAYQPQSREVVRGVLLFCPRLDRRIALADGVVSCPRISHLQDVKMRPVRC